MAKDIEKKPEQKSWNEKEKEETNDDEVDTPTKDIKDKREQGKLQ